MNRVLGVATLSGGAALVIHILSGVDYQVFVEAEGYEAIWGDIRFDRRTPDSVELEDIWLVRR